MKNTTDFGYQQVPWQDKQEKVAQVFHNVADQYDIMNDFMSLGIHRLWKRFTIELSGIRAGQQVLDVAGGTGDLTKQFAKRVGKNGHVYLVDINSSMLQCGRDRLIDANCTANVTFIQTNAEALPFADNTFDCISIAFGLRNVTDKDKALRSMQRIVKPGGRLLILEFSKLVVPALQPLYDTYSFTVLPWLGKKIAGDAESYRYLAESIRMHPDQETLKSMVLAAGFDQCDYYNLSGGLVALHRAYKW